MRPPLYKGRGLISFAKYWELTQGKREETMSTTKQLRETLKDDQQELNIILDKYGYKPRGLWPLEARMREIELRASMKKAWKIVRHELREPSEKSTPNGWVVVA